VQLNLHKLNPVQYLQDAIKILQKKNSHYFGTGLQMKRVDLVVNSGVSGGTPETVPRRRETDRGVMVEERGPHLQKRNGKSVGGAEYCMRASGYRCVAWWRGRD